MRAIMIVYFLISIMSVLFIACTREIDINLNDNKDPITNASGSSFGNIDFGGTNGSKVDFTCELGVLGSSTPLSSGKYVTVYIYKYRSSTSRIPFARRLYKSGANGKLMEISTPVYLPTGYYNFYAVSSNSIPDQTPLFSLGNSVTIKHGVDYVWTSMKKIDIYSSPVTLPLTLEHLCFKLSLYITDSFFTILWKVESVSINLPSGKQYIELATGDISPQFLNSTKSYNMNLKYRTASLMIPPFKTNKKLTLTIKARTNIDVLKLKTFVASFSIPKGGFLPGHQYNYKVVVDDEGFKVKEHDSVEVLK